MMADNGDKVVNWQMAKYPDFTSSSSFSLHLESLNGWAICLNSSTVELRFLRSREFIPSIFLSYC